MSQRSMLTLGVAATGLAIAAAAQVVAPVVVPLFDGVVVNEPYRYVTPPPGEAGSPTSASSRLAIAQGVSPAFAVYTSETPPQAELVARGGELAVRPQSTSVTVTIDPMQAPAGEASDRIAGNIYRFLVIDQAGTALGLAPGQSITLALRGPMGTEADATIARFADGRWEPLTTQPSGLQDLFITNAIAFGDFALLGAIEAAPGGTSPVLLIGALVVAALVTFLSLRRRGSSGSRPVGGSAPRRPQWPARRRDHP